MKIHHPLLEIQLDQLDDSTSESDQGTYSQDLLSSLPSLSLKSQGLPDSPTGDYKPLFSHTNVLPFVSSELSIDSFVDVSDSVSNKNEGSSSLTQTDEDEEYEDLIRKLDSIINVKRAPGSSVLSRISSKPAIPAAPRELLPLRASAHPNSNKKTQISIPKIEYNTIVAEDDTFIESQIKSLHQRYHMPQQSDKGPTNNVLQSISNNIMPRRESKETEGFSLASLEYMKKHGLLNESIISLSSANSSLVIEQNPARNSSRSRRTRNPGALRDQNYSLSYLQ